jgi:hypothetical protein
LESYHINNPSRESSPRLDASTIFQQRAMQRERYARERAETECESSVLVCVGMHFFLLLTVWEATKHPWLRPCDESGVSLCIFSVALEVPAMGTLEDAPVFA